MDNENKPEITLTKETATFAAAHAQDRNQLHTTHDTTNTWGVNYKETDEIGVLGEAAFASYYSLSIDTELRPDGDNGIDFVVSWDNLSITIDLKATKYLSDPHLLVRAAKEHHADVFVLVGVDHPDAKLFGWLPTHSVINTPTTESPYGHQNHRIHHSELNPMPNPDELHDISNETSIIEPQPDQSTPVL